MVWDIVNKKDFMNYLYKNSEKATLRLNQNSITVYGETAKFINAVAVCTVLLISVALIAKACK
jgi:hypothetical protein